MALLAEAVGEPPAEVERVFNRYGKALAAVLEDYQAFAASREPRLAWLKAQVRQSVRGEMAVRLDDIMRQRTSMILFNSDNGLAHVEELAAVMGRMLRWSTDREIEEVSRCQQLAQEMFAWREEMPAASASTA